MLSGGKSSSEERLQSLKPAKPATLSPFGPTDVTNPLRISLMITPHDSGRAVPYETENANPREFSPLGMSEGLRHRVADLSKTLTC